MRDCDTATLSEWEIDVVGPHAVRGNQADCGKRMEKRLIYAWRVRGSKNLDSTAVFGVRRHQLRDGIDNENIVLRCKAIHCRTWKPGAE
jgi:hypothetical protein